MPNRMTLGTPRLHASMLSATTFSMDCW